MVASVGRADSVSSHCRTQEEMNGSLKWSLLSQETDLSVLVAVLSQYLMALQVTSSFYAVGWGSSSPG